MNFKLHAFFQEVLFQTKFMRTILAATENHCLDDDIEILCPSISRKNLHFLVQFLYKGSIPCSDNKIGNLSGDIDNKTVKIKIFLRMSSLTNKQFIWKHNSRVFLQRQLWIHTVRHL